MSKFKILKCSIKSIQSPWYNGKSPRLNRGPWNNGQNAVNRLRKLLPNVEVNVQGSYFTIASSAYRGFKNHSHSRIDRIRTRLARLRRAYLAQQAQS